MVDDRLGSRLTDELYRLLKSPAGATPEVVGAMPGLMSLRHPGAAREGEQSHPGLVGALQVVDAIRSAASDLGTLRLSERDPAFVDYPSAARAYLALEPGTRNQPPASRRQRAARETGKSPNAMARTRKSGVSQEAQLMSALAQALADRELEYLRVVQPVRSDPGAQLVAALSFFPRLWASVSTVAEPMVRRRMWNDMEPESRAAEEIANRYWLRLQYGSRAALVHLVGLTDILDPAIVPPDPAITSSLNLLHWRDPDNPILSSPFPVEVEKNPGWALAGVFDAMPFGARKLSELSEIIDLPRPVPQEPGLELAAARRLEAADPGAFAAWHRWLASCSHSFGDDRDPSCGPDRAWRALSDYIMDVRRVCTKIGEAISAPPKHPELYRVDAIDNVCRVCGVRPFSLSA